MESHGDSIESVHSLMMEVSLSASLEDMKNPTEEFIVNIICEFFKTFLIDVEKINRLTLDQQNALDVTSPDNAGIAHLLNLREVMEVIGHEIFIKDFQITDITSPRQIRTKKILKFIVNFILYARNKRQQMQEKIDEVLSRAEKLQHCRKKKQEIIERMNKQAMIVAQKKDEIEKFKREIKEENEATITPYKIKIMNKDKVINEKKKLETEKVSMDNAKRAELRKLREKLDEFKGKVVKSPEKIRNQLTELEKSRKDQEEKRKLIQESILHKKILLQDFESASIIVKKEYGTLKEIIKDQKKFEAVKKCCKRLNEDIEEAMRNINLAEKLGNHQDHQTTAEAIEQFQIQCQKRTDKLRKTYFELDCEKKCLERKKENVETRYAELCSETSSICEKIPQVEEEISSFLQQCQQLYDSEINKVIQLRNIFPFQ